MSTFDVTVFRANPDASLRRRTHKKSRDGCLACKKRRTKCGEERPGCVKCSNTKTACIYDTESSVQLRSSKTRLRDGPSLIPPGSLNTAAQTMAVDGVRIRLSDLFALDQHAPPASLSTVRLLQHFQSIASATLGDSTVQHVMSSHVAHNSWSQPYTMHMLLAVSSAHLQRLTRASTTPEESRRSTLAEAEHWHNGLALYRAALASPASRNPTAHNVDALIGTTFLSVIFAFALEDQIPANAFLTNYDEAVAHALSPLAAGSGILALDHAVPMQSAVAWMPVLRKGNDRVGTYTDQSPGTAGLPPAFVRLCGVDEQSCAVNNEYHSILRLLAPLLRLERSVEHFTKLIAFGGRTFGLFRPLLRKRDARALLLLAYWIALLRQLDQWWLNVRVRSSCAAIVTYLRTVGDPGVEALLAFPALGGEGGYEYLWDSPVEE
ncbi:hypothetical protein LTR91_014168 [Friedmanniomyces endolithicus]|uniref:Zn(2)-C6 fungal-type domain-containing protein n=1 Tax=Friedmanniomyces endolithicus TaxID=329885 RepID=A0AAN6QPP8_9PEZI|nr:hypothetical protein LTR94_014835 [Friedmanniomyces endolithicus]KAK0778019.1 hypothetical protein LTR38_014936 [Friedmanniomyces endolithicus]KAK0778418.1 hypothetical protein LTR59_013515 [Friedmanniomyces endolithicus]KAK0789361.1 hypothetical protein LTR75_012349 [Friedmanniomyces endolithicus]KAK0871613.1 hypothetical protein LTR87_012775 [Friedmanniomyces endolithicus]